MYEGFFMAFGECIQREFLRNADGCAHLIFLGVATKKILPHDNSRGCAGSCL